MFSLICMPFLMAMSCQNPFNSDKDKPKESGFVFCPEEPCTQTWQGFFDAGPSQEGTPLDSSGMFEIAAVGSSLYARTITGDLYIKKKSSNWLHISTPKQATYYVMKEHQGLLYLALAQGGIWKLDEQGQKVSEIPYPPEDTMCILGDFERNCRIMNIAFLKDQIFLDVSNDSYRKNFLWNGLTWKSIDNRVNRHQNLTTLNSGIRQIWNYKDSVLLFATYGAGFWSVDTAGNWKRFTSLDSVFVASAAEPMAEVDWGGGIADLNGQIFAGSWDGRLTKLNPSTGQFDPYPMKNKHFYIYNLDTLCGNLVLLQSLQFMKPGESAWRALTVAPGVAYRQYHATERAPIYYGQAGVTDFSKYNITWGTFGTIWDMLRVGDTLYMTVGDVKFVSSEYTKLGQTPLKGKVIGFNLRNSPLCADAWARGQAERGVK